MQPRLLAGPEPEKPRIVYPTELQVKCVECGKWSPIAKFQGILLEPGVFIHICMGKDRYDPPEHFNCRSSTEPFFGFDEAGPDLNIETLMRIRDKIFGRR
jgi:hypothetical protein